MRALRHDGTGLVLDRHARAPVAGAGEALVRPLLCGISRHDVEIARGWREGRAAFAGAMGHEVVGVVESLGDGADKAQSRRLVGTMVVCTPLVVCGRCARCRAGLQTHCESVAGIGLHGRDGCLADLVCVPAANLVDAAELDSDQAVLSYALAGAADIAQVVRVERKPYITVLGDSIDALLCAQVLAQLNASVRLLGSDPQRFGLCERWGVKHRHIDDVGRRHDQDIVVDCTWAGLGLALELVRPRGTVVLKGPEWMAPAEWAGAGECVGVRGIAAGEVHVIGARSGSLARAVGMLGRGEVGVHGLITRRVRLEEGTGAVRDAERELKVVVSV